MLNLIARLLGSVFFLGYLPLIPGTFASLFGLLLFYLIKDRIILQVYIAAVLVILGLVFGGRAEQALGRKDDKRIVIDEISGMLLALLFIPPDPRMMTLAFILFRILDTMKPFPAARLQNLKAGPGIMSDDIVAGLYTNIILQVVLKLA